MAKPPERPSGSRSAWPPAACSTRWPPSARQVSLTRTPQSSRRRSVPILGGALIALEFLTPLRLRRVQTYEDRTFAEALGWYPFIGLLIGLCLCALDRGLSELLPPVPTAVLLVAFLALASGGLHLDGIADTADGMAVQGDRARRLGVMSEGNTGPAGVMALLFILMAEWAAIVSLDGTIRGPALIIAPALGRWAVVPVGLIFKPARPRGLGHAMQTAMLPIAAPLATVIGAGAAIVLFGVAGIILIIAATVAALLIAALAARMLDGVTGDVFGAAIEVAQVVVWLSLVAAGMHGWTEPLVG
ncbi:MAG: adenosylcobinamide-GDP ribazoletransferase [Dehalococcoidia bacterium]|nr:adenosylcobinamide-GDP ribazoletransferase [Dehalococcoidia bacterium]